MGAAGPEQAAQPTEIEQLWLVPGNIKNMIGANIELVDANAGVSSARRLVVL
jgi:hypothetical protein